MSLSATIEKDFVAAYKAKEATKVAVLRMLKAAIKNKQVELGRAPTDDEVLGIVTKQAKQRQESIDQFTQAGRTDLAEKELTELKELEKYLPALMSDEELAALVDKVITETNPSGMKDMGRVMQAVMAAGKGGVDGKKASALVRAKLAD